jgi:AraC family transcriptional regulator of adaptative response/methylated-DNA-[protein]-cysteine methyltransferase
MRFRMAALSHTRCQPLFTMDEMTTPLDDDACWRAVTTKDRSQDGRFVFGVRTTGIFCRPSCPARTPRRTNVRFYRSVAEAALAGLRPCLRCRPLEPHGAGRTSVAIGTTCEYIRAHADERLSLEALAKRSGLSRFHLQRSFKAALGITPTQYQDACRLARFKSGLRQGHTVTTAMYDAGFGSSSRLYSRVDTRLGMTPAQYRAGGVGVEMSCGSAATPLGTLMVAATDRGLCFVQFGQSHAVLLDALRAEYPSADIVEMRKPYPPQFDAWMAAVVDHIHDIRQPLHVPLDVRATAFQLAVWRYLQTIPVGEVRTYAQVARDLGQPAAARAVARACATNRVALVVPCHRVIRGDGSLAGYRWGVERKRVLLDRERQAVGRPAP